MKGVGKPCTGHCGEWVESEDEQGNTLDMIVCPFCKEDRFCGWDCFWREVAQCPDYEQQKQQFECFTSRSVVNRMFARIRQDPQMIDCLRKRLSDPHHMIVFYIQDEATLAALLSNNRDWKQTILAGVESRPSLHPTKSVLSFQFALYCTKTKELHCEVL